MEGHILPKCNTTECSREAPLVHPKTNLPVCTAHYPMEIHRGNTTTTRGSQLQQSD